MAAIISEKFRTHNAKQFKEDFAEATSSTFVFIGRSFAWPDDSDPPAPANSVGEETEAFTDMIAIKKVTSADVSHGLTRYDWTLNTTYDEYSHDISASDPSTATTASSLYDSRFYVITDEYNVYKCIRTGRDSGGSVVVSTTKPTGTSATNLVFGGEGGAGGLPYIWKYMFSVSASDTIKFVTNDFIPVKTLGAQASVNGGGTNGQLGSAADDDGSSLWDVENSAVQGAIYHYKIISAGTGYQDGVGASTFTQDINVDGDGSGSVVTVSVVGGAIDQVYAKDASSYGTGYRQATVDVSELLVGFGGEIRPILSPITGHGSDPVEELGGNFVIVNSRLEFAEGAGDFPIDNDFRRIGLLQDPFVANSTTLATGDNYACYSRMVLSSVAQLTPDDIIMSASANGNSVAVSRIISINGATREVSHLPIANLGGSYVNFVDGDSVYLNGVQVATIGVGGVDATFPEISRYTGGIMYLENRGAVSRAADQIEDIKLIIEM